VLPGPPKGRLADGAAEEESMSEIALAAAALAALAVVVLVIRVLFLVRRVQRVWDQLDRTIESDLAPGIRAWGDAARGVQRAAGKLDTGLSSLATTLSRVERASEKLDSGLLMGSVVSKLGAWLAGVRRGLARAQHHHEGPRRSAETPEGEGEPGD